MNLVRHSFSILGRASYISFTGQFPHVFLKCLLYDTNFMHPTYSPYDTTYSGNTDLDNHVESESDAEETEAETQEETVADENAVFTP